MRKEDLQTAALMSLPAVVFLVFLILKLSGVITWSWWWITSPLWIVVGLVLLLSLIYIIALVMSMRKLPKQ